MSTMPLSRAQFKAKLDQLICKANAATVVGPTGIQVLDAVRATLLFFDSRPEAQGSEGTPLETSFEFPEVVSFVRDLLPVPYELFSPSFFSQSMLPFMVLHEVGTLYDCDTIDQVYLDLLQLAANERNNRSFMIYVWLPFFLNCTIDV